MSATSPPRPGPAPEGVPRAHPVLPALVLTPAEQTPQWHGFDHEISPLPAQLIGFGDEHLGEAAAPADAAAAPAIAFVPAAIPAASARPAAARPRRQAVLTVLSLLLLAYAVLGRGAAYLGIPLGGGNSIFIGELALSFGLAALLVKGGYERFFALPIAMPWLFFVLWNAAQTLPYLSQYGMTALRDGAEWGYSLFAVVVSAALLARPDGFAILLENYRRFARWFVLAVPLIAAITIYSDRIAPAGFLAHFVDVRFGDGLVNLAGAMAFAACGLVVVRAPWWWILGVDLVVLGSHNRGGLIAFLAGAAVVLLCSIGGDLRGAVRHFARFGGALGLLLVLSFVVDLRIDAYSNERAISPQQLVLNLVGSFESTGVDALDETREWRLEWWNRILDYTLHGRYFWTGKGYGINLADDDGFQVIEEGQGPPLRSPHNSHLTFLARSGVPGLALWAVLQLSWLWSVLGAFRFARRTRRRTTAGLFTFFLAYWTAAMLEAATDVTFEAPYAAIWFWTIFGVGAAAVRMVRRDADWFERTPFVAAGATATRAVGRWLLRPAPLRAR
jgi:hypothetical protein